MKKKKNNTKVQQQKQAELHKARIQKYHVYLKNLGLPDGINTFPAELHHLFFSPPPFPKIITPYEKEVSKGEKKFANKFFRQIAETVTIDIKEGMTPLNMPD